MKKIPPGLLARILLGGLLALPLLATAWLLSRGSVRRWKERRTVIRFLRRHRGVSLGDVDLSTVKVETISGGVSNCSFLWSGRTRGGEPFSYLAKVFLPMGSAWAWLLPILGPFPKIRPVSRRNRLNADVLTRNRLVSKGVPVPEPFLTDPAAGITVSQYLQGEPVTKRLTRAADRGGLTEEDKEVLKECGALLGRIHRAGISMVDAQPANCFWVPRERRVYMVDFEYATLADEKKWDFGFFLAFISAQLEGTLRTEAQEAFRQGYVAATEAGGAALLPNGRDLEGFLPVFQIILELRDFSPETLTGFGRPPAETLAAG